MGANMQRQAVPLLRPAAPFVGTGIEYQIASDSGLALRAQKEGVVSYADGKRIQIAGDKTAYNLIKFRKSNQETVINQKPLVRVGDTVKVGEIIADGPAMENGELALGQNVLIAFSTWSGYNYEDAIVLSDRLVKDDTFTSIHVSEHTVRCVRTKVGDEEITRELPNMSEDAKRYLDADGIIMIGAEVKEGDVLVGKITPRGQVDLSSEERLLQAIFGEKTKNVKETSMRVPHGGEGVVGSIKRFTLSNSDDLDDDVIELIKVYIVQKRKIQVGDKMSGRHGNKGVISRVVPAEDMPHLEDGTPVDVVLNPQGVPSRMNIGQVLEIHLGLAAHALGMKKLFELVQSKNANAQIQQTFGMDSEVANAVANRVRKLITLRGGVANVSPIEVQIELKALGIELSRIGIKFATPVFDGVSRNDLTGIMAEAGLETGPGSGKFTLIDGRTGEKFDQKVAVGVMYFLKLGHMVDDKIHSRAIGPYSKITQQPLGGYGAAYTLRELLTLKSDDVRGRNQTYAAIIKGQPIPEPGVPESFKLLTKELQGLGLLMTVIDENGKRQDVNMLNRYEAEEQSAVAPLRSIISNSYQEEDNF
ncbi:unnamed protein product [Didymodactylos carnosus]|uniref:DNA-directed RNA polymerase n=1 Tax=Didymodactylos carnosus TaxID=1234261 RepID=A0A8S2CLQ1_9BILA|nr:unnamed protein product [Didymodactylos carnosus]CAF3492161.1 unnamed protein product [Didymodactylos carnosus]